MNQRTAKLLRKIVALTPSVSPIPSRQRYQMLKREWKESTQAERTELRRDIQANINNLMSAKHLSAGQP